MKHLEKLRKDRNKKLINFTPDELYNIFPPYVIIKKNKDFEIKDPNKKISNFIKNKNIIKTNKEILYSQDSYKLLFKKGCITCGKTNFWVKYHGELHWCLKCREQLISKNGNKVKLFLNEDNIPLVFEEVKLNKIIIIENNITYNNIIDSKLNKKYKYNQIKNNEIYFNNIKCICTLSDIDEMIVVPF